MFTIIQANQNVRIMKTPMKRWESPHVVSNKETPGFRKI